MVVGGAIAVATMVAKVGFPSILPIGAALTENYATVELVGDEIRGEKKYGRAVEADNGCIYMTPFTSKRVLEYNISTSKWRYIGLSVDIEESNRDVFGNEDNNWKKKGFYDSAVLGKDGMVYGIPCNAHKVLKIDPSTGSTEFVGDNIQTQLGWRYAVVDPDSGMIYGIPSNAQQVLRYNPYTQRTTLIGPKFEGDDKWGAGVIASDGCLYCVPSCATQILKFDLKKETGELVGWDFGKESNKFCGAAISSDGIIYGIPLCESRVLKFDVKEQMTSWIWIGDKEFSTKNEANFGGGNFGADGKLYLSPSNGKRVARLNVKTGKTEFIGDEYDGDQKWVHAVNASDGNMYLVPYMAKQILKIDIWK